MILLTFLGKYCKAHLLHASGLYYIQLYGLSPQGFLRGAVWKFKKDSKNVLKKILKINGLEGDFEIDNWDCQSNGKGIAIAFRPKGTLTV